MRTWKTLRKELVLDSPWMKVFKEAVVTGSGWVVDDFYTAVRRDVAMVAARTADGRVVLIREYKHASGDVVWQLPAGAIDDGELPLAAAARELKEETGMRAGSYRLLGSWYAEPTWLSTRVFVVAAENCEVVSAQELEGSEEIEVNPVSMDEALAMVARNEIKDAHSCLALLWLAQWNNC